MEKKHIEFIIETIEEDSTLSVRKLSEIIISEFNLEVSRTKIVKILKQNEYMYKQAKLKINSEEPQQNVRENSWFRHLHTTNFYEVFFTDETLFYLDNPARSRFLKDEEYIIFSRKNGEKEKSRGISRNICLW